MLHGKNGLMPHVTSREGRVSRNSGAVIRFPDTLVTSREGRVSRNPGEGRQTIAGTGHVPRGTCE